MGPKYTWQRGNLHQCLDRALGNDIWQAAVLHVTVRHLHKLKSDHRPILVSTHKGQDGGKERPFKFLASWLDHSKFIDVVRQSWKNARLVFVNLDLFTALVKEWNSTVFGNIFYHKRRTIRELERI